MASSPTVAVIDIGSNSIKLLVAALASDGGLETRFARTLDARISAGISQADPKLSDEGMQTGLGAIRTLLDDARENGATQTILVGTSAVRDAGNGHSFRDQVREATGHEIRILSGVEEAALIGRGLTCDPALRDLRTFYVFDLGGGSLECLAFVDRKPQQSVSLQLGCVRLMEQLVRNPANPFSRIPRFRVMQHVHDELVRSPFHFDLPLNSAAIATGGTMTTARAILGAQDGRSLEETPAYVALTQLRLMLTRVSRLTLDERKAVPGLPAARADVFPTALATLIVLANVGGLAGFRHSLYNLRYGIAAEALGLEA